ncbi:MAG TPA: M23 family metallopeptidase [Gammaproteobacteria bacterium]|nr:M23 family metallopeptidase [Gammaproteobacteria bacterium]
MLLLVLGAGAAVGAYAAQRYAAERYASRAREIQPALGAWHRGFEADKARLETSRRSAERAVARLASQLAQIQAQIVELDALARGVIEDTEPASRDIDFDEEPALGGPDDDAEVQASATDLERTADLLGAQVDDRAKQLHVLEDLLEWREHLSAVRPEGRPVASGYVSSGFGVRIDPFTGRKQQHSGMDFAARRGTEVVAVASGIVTWTGPRGGYGQLVEIDHGNGRVTRYGHNAEVLVRVGQIVRRGQPIARLGATGRATGPNLHFEVRENGQAVDPRPFVKGQDVLGHATLAQSPESPASRGGRDKGRASPASRPSEPSQARRARALSPGQVAEAEPHRQGERRQIAALVVESDAEVLEKVPAQASVDHAARVEAPLVQ